jgi:alpha-galactosidase
MVSKRIELRLRDQGGTLRTLVLGPDGVRTERAGVVLSARRQSLDGGNVVRTTISNRSDSTIRLDSLRLDIATGFSADEPARFFKHGYQSWSASHPVAIGSASDPDSGRSLIARVSHQSEVCRPNEAPESATSELFTLVESDSSPERFLAGFIGAANQLTTITVRKPDLVLARALLDGATLHSGEVREVEPLAYWRSEEPAARMAARWVAMLGDAMRARVKAPYQRGWCSWYYYFHGITEDALMSNLRALKEMRLDYPIEVVQLDDGYQAAVGDWKSTNAKFPSGLKKIAATIRDAGFTAGLWTAPFLAARDSQLMREHSDWFIRDENGGPLRAAYVPDWITDEDKFAYALDPSNPSFSADLELLFETIVHDFGYDYLKLDFLFAAAAEGIRYDNGLTRAEALRRGLEAIRRGAGENAFILGCGCPLGPAVGIVDGMRIGPDVAPCWGVGAGRPGEPGTALALDAIMARSFMHRRLWLNDPDCLMLRTKETSLSDDERHALAWTIAASGGLLLISDDMGLLGREHPTLFRTVARIGAEVDAASEDEPPGAADLMEREAVRIVSTRTRDGALHLLLNMSEHAKDVRIAEVLPRYGLARIIEPENEVDAAERIELPAHSARIIRTS